MFQQMEKARKEELEKATVRKVTVKSNDIGGVGVDKDRFEDKKVVAGMKCGEGVNCSASEVTFGGRTSDNISANGNNVIHAGTAEKDRSVVHKNVFHKDNVEKDVCNEDIEINTEEEQLKILQEIKSRNELKMKQEEMDMKLISQLSLAEAEQQLPDSCSGAAAAGDSWPDLGQAVAAAGHVLGGGETARQKIARLKETAERRGMSVNTIRERRLGEGEVGLERRRLEQNGLGRRVDGREQSLEDFLASSQKIGQENGKHGKKEVKKTEKMIRERRKSEAMTELEVERRRAAEELKDRIAAQERELWEQLGRGSVGRGRRDQDKRRTKSGK